MSIPATIAEQLRMVSARVPRIRALVEGAETEQQERGYSHTLREIVQQPLTWPDTAARLHDSAALVAESLSKAGIPDRQGAIVLIGSGSSLYAGASARASLASMLGVPTQATPAGDVLTHLATILPPDDGLLAISVARSGNSPESCAAVDLLLERRPRVAHLVVTCCANGKLATRYAREPRVRTVLLDEATCDQSLVMTSSFTNLALSCRFPGFIEHPHGFADLTARLSATAQALLLDDGAQLSDIGSGSFRSAIFLGSGDRFQSARESALKMLEMTAGQIATFPETFLGLRHGPMSTVHDDGLVVCFVSTDPIVRAYELDVIGELNEKDLKAQKVIVGEDLPTDLAREGDAIVECAGLTAIGDLHAPIIDALVGQLLAFFRCLSLGLQPDTPSPTGIITRVVRDFRIYQ